MNLNKKIKMGSVVKGYTVFPIIVGVIFLLATVGMFFVDIRAGLVMVGVCVVYAAFAAIFLTSSAKKVSIGAMKFAREYHNMEKTFIKNFPIPYAVVSKEGIILTYNRRFSKIYSGPIGAANICDVFTSVIPADLSFEGFENDISVVFNKRNYRLHFNRIAVPAGIGEDSLISLREGDKYVIAVYLHDETEIVNLMKSAVEQQMVVANLYVDSYEETLDQVDDIKKSMIAALIDREVVNYFAKYGGIVRKIEKSKYFIIFKRRMLSAMQRNKFDILDNIRGIETGIEMPVTISLGIGLSDDYTKCVDFARVAIELALGRGGDQAVVKDGERVYFYGGKTKSVEKNTRVKARVTSLALKEILIRKDRVVIMGHKASDIDCLGASIGIYKAAKALGKPAFIVLNELTNTVQPILENFLDTPEYANNVFIPVEDSSAFVDENTALVIVDVNKPDFIENPKLIHKTNTIIMIDHHLQSGERVENLALSYIEPTASSASEMVTELLRYITDDIKLTKLEAEALYAGILIDTNYFAKNTGVKTFEAAAYLRRSGVDVARVKGLFSDTLEDFKAKAETIKTAEMIADGFAIAVGPTEGIESPTIVAAQVANELLDINGVKGSFVLVDYDGKIFISARSTGDVNVQRVMERMGGGGHMNSAGAQLVGMDMDEGVRKLKMTVKKMIEEGAL